MDIALSSKSLSQTRSPTSPNNKLEPILKGIPNVQTVDIYGASAREFHVVPIPARSLGTGATLRDVFAAVRPTTPTCRVGSCAADAGDKRLGPRRDQQRARPVGYPASDPRNVEQESQGRRRRVVFDSHVEPRPSRTTTGSRAFTSSWGAASPPTRSSRRKIARDQLKTIEAQIIRYYVQRDRRAGRLHAEIAQRRLAVLIEGIILTAIVMLLFLHAWRNALVVMIAIPSRSSRDVHRDESVRASRSTSSR